MIKSLFNARSPLWQLLFSYVAVWFMLLIGLDAMINLESFDSLWLSIPGILVSILLMIAYAVTVYSHNRRHPDAKVRVFQVSAPELIEQDEMLEASTRLATKQVYKMNVYALPILFVVVMIFNGNPVQIAISFAVYLTAYYITYLRVILPQLKD